MPKIIGSSNGKTEAGPGKSSIARGLSLIDAVCDSPTPISLSRLARATEMESSGAYRILQVLIKEGWVSKLEETREYSVGPRALVGFAPWHPFTTFRRESYAFLEHAYNDLGETVALILFLGTERVVVDVIHGKVTLSAYYDVRLQSPIHGSASGLILLSSMPNEKWRNLMGAEPFPTHTPNTVTTSSELATKIELIREERMAISRDEAFPDLVAYGAPICYRNQVLGCLIATASSPSIDPSKDYESAMKLRETAQKLTSTVPSIHTLSHFLLGST